MKYLWIILFVLLFFPGNFKVFAQQKPADSASRFEKGDISEIKDKHRVYLVAYKSYQSQNIIKSLKKYSSVEIVSNVSDADYIIIFDVERMAFNTQPSSVAGAPPATENAQYFGHLYVYIPSKTNKNRIVWEMRSRYLDSPRIDTVKKELTWQEPIEKSLIGKFINDLKKLRGEK